MRKALFTLALLASAFLLPLTAHADTVDDFTLVGQGHTITYSLPATSAFPDFFHFNSFTESAPTTIDGVSGYVESGQYFFPGLNTPRLLIGVPSSVFGVGFLEFSGPVFFTATTEPASNPPPDFQDDVVPTFTPGIYTLQSLGPALQPFSPPVFYTLTITPETSTASTPEPASLTLLATGALGIMSVATKRKRERQVLN
ncbi:MAG TPA: PEP-CTERM sorting domain-containing protein [Edaphobacter sp.]|nr:PEP-CTERM sorting domain-containing protein [Edaphobacter sp.]